MANSVELCDVEMKCEPDSTADIVEVEEVAVAQEQTPLQAMNHQLLERQHLCATMVAASERERDRVRAQLVEAIERRKEMLEDLDLIVTVTETAKTSCLNIKTSLRDAISKRMSLLKEFEAEKLWRPPSADMCLKKQQGLRERVAHMKTILTIGTIRTPDDVIIN